MKRRSAHVTRASFTRQSALLSDIARFVRICALVRPYLGVDQVILRSGGRVTWQQWMAQPLWERSGPGSYSVTYPGSLLRFMKVALAHWEGCPAFGGRGLQNEVSAGKQRFVTDCNALARELPALVCTGRIGSLPVLLPGEESVGTKRGLKEQLWLHATVADTIEDGAPFLSQLGSHWDSWVFGTIAAPQDVQTFNEAMLQCWWFPSWICPGGAAPDDEAVAGIKAVYRHLRPDLQHTEWPPLEWRHDGCGERVERVWPSEEGIVSQYAHFRQAIHDVFNSKHALRDFAVASCLDVTMYTVELINCPFQVGAPWRASSVKGRRAKRLRLLNVARHTKVLGMPFRVSSKHVTDVSQSDVPARTFRAPMLCKLTKLRSCRRLNGCLARVRSRTEELDQERLLAFIESTPSLSSGCWHVARLLHRCRRSGSCEAVVEGWNSTLESLADKRQHPTCGSLIDRLKLCTNGVTAVGGKDEKLVDAVATHLRALDPYLRISTRSRKSLATAEVVASAKFRWPDHEFDKLDVVDGANRPDGRLKRFLRLPCAGRAKDANHSLGAEDRRRVAGATTTAWAAKFLSKSRRIGTTLAACNERKTKNRLQPKLAPRVVASSSKGVTGRLAVPSSQKGKGSADPRLAQPKRKLQVSKEKAVAAVLKHFPLRSGRALPLSNRHGRERKRAKLKSSPHA